MNNMTQHLKLSLEENNNPNSPIKYKLNLTQDTEYEYFMNSASNSEDVEMSDGMSSSSPTITILGDQLVREYAQEISIQRHGNRWNNIYSVFGMSKPYASCAQVLSGFDKLAAELKSSDILVLGFGSNDKEPYLILNHLCSTLRKIGNNKVFILNVLNNEHLNTDLLNGHMELLTEFYSNCTFIKTTDMMVTGHRYNYVSKSVMCYKINIEIDNMDRQK